MGRPLIVDGGLATGLEEQGHKLHPWLWSAGVFLENPAAVERLHRAYLAAGAEILIGASYQMSFEGLARAGLDRPAAADAMRRTVAVARAACCGHAGSPIVAASVGPYGAILADGSEYHGNYGLDEEQLTRFHRERFEVLTDAGADLLAIETVPSLVETAAFVRLISNQGRTPVWVSFTCRNATEIGDGTPISRAVALLHDCDLVRAVGVNCTDPDHVSDLMDRIREGTDKPIVVYPNSGERWDAARRRWTGRFNRDGFLRRAVEWSAKGAWAIGGCCRVSPRMIRELRLRLDAGVGDA